MALADSTKVSSRRQHFLLVHAHNYTHTCKDVDPFCVCVCVCSGVNRALRSSHMRESRSTNAPDDLSELGPNQNILELHISEASLQVGALCFSLPLVSLCTLCFSLPLLSLCTLCVFPASAFLVHTAMLCC